MKTTSLALTVSKIRLATVVLPDPVPPQMPMTRLTGASMGNRSIYELTACVLISGGIFSRRIAQPRDHPTQHARECVTSASSDLEHVFMIDRLIIRPGRHVRDAGYTQHLHPHLPRHDRFRDGAHAHCVSAE